MYKLTIIPPWRPALSTSTLSDSTKSVFDLLDFLNEGFPDFPNFETLLEDQFDRMNKNWTFNWSIVENSYVKEFELPRFRKENIKVTVEGDKVHIAAEQDNLKFYETLSLPPDSNKDIKVNLSHGILTITSGKNEPPKPLEITIEDSTEGKKSLDAK